MCDDGRPPVPTAELRAHVAELRALHGNSLSPQDVAAQAGGGWPDSRGITSSGVVGVACAVSSGGGQDALCHFGGEGHGFRRGGDALCRVFFFEKKMKSPPFCSFY